MPTADGYQDAFLGVAQSASNARWQAVEAALNDTDLDRYAGGLSEVFPDMPLPITRLLAARGLSSEAVQQFLEPKLRELLPDPSRFQDMDKAANRLADIVEASQPIGVFGDYDVDGASAAALLVNVMRELGVHVDVHIPDRFTEGYGPNIDALMKLRASGAELLVTVDCGITAHGPLDAVANTGMDVIVIDHHIAGPELPRAHSVINPNRLDEDGEYGSLCAAGVVFITLVAVLRELRTRGFFKDGQAVPDLMMQLDIVALATVCDVVPLIGLNRAFVGQGLKVMAKRGNPGVAKLADIAGLNRAPDAHSLGFLLGPRINAGGRVGASGIGVRLLSTTSADEAAGLAARLDELNTQRKQIESDIRAAAIDRADAVENPVILLGDEQWHEGVIGIVAGRVRERFGKPACIIAFDANGVGKGSGRSIPGFRLGSAIIAAHQQGILLGGGGHDMAAGFSIHRDNLPAFQAFLDERLGKDLKGEIPQLVHKVSGLLSTSGVQPELADWLDRLGPFGSGNAEPRFVLPDCQVTYAKLVGADGAHLSCRLDDGSGGTLNAIAFQAGGTDLGQFMLAAKDGRRVHVLGKIRRDTFRGGRSMQIEIEDVAGAPSSFLR